jgi:prepilin-type N-terminal cleavage/methylation domain-containing protein
VQINLKKTLRRNEGFSLLELLISMTIMLILLGIVSTLMARAFSVRTRESQKTDALTSAQAALNVISREVANSGFGIHTGTNTRRGSNGIVLADSTATQLRVRSNIINTGLAGATNTTAMRIDRPGEDLTYYFDAATSSIVRYDPNDTPQTSVVVNKISDVQFEYFSYTGTNSTGVQTTTPTDDTGRVRIRVLVQLDPIQGQPNPLDVQFTTEVTLRNSNYMLNQY